MTFQQVSVNQDTTEGTNYPFVRQPPDTSRFLLGDLWLAYDDDNYKLPFKVTELRGFDSIPTAINSRQNVVIKDADNRTVFDTSVTGVRFTQRAWGVNLSVLEWYKDGSVLRCTHHRSWPAWAPTRTTPSVLSGLNLELDPRTYCRLPKRVKSIRIGLTKIKGDLIFSEGYNVGLTTETPRRTEGGRSVRRVLIDATPGNGLGRAPGCDSTDTIVRKIAGVGPNAGGDLSIDAPGCYRAQRPTTVVTASPRTVAPALPVGDSASYLPTPALPYSLDATALAAAIQLSNDCKPCCTCEDYVDTNKGALRIEQAYRDFAARAQTAAAHQKTAIERWEAQRECRLIQPLKLVVQGEANNGLYVAGLHCNMTRGCTSTLVLRVTVQSFRSGEPVTLNDVKIRCPETYRTGTDTRGAEVRTVPSGEWPVYDFYFDTSDPQATSRFRARIKLNGATNNDTVRVTLSVHVAESVNPATGKHYPLADTAHVLGLVPSDVKALWTTRPQPAPIRAFTQITKAVGPSVGCGVCP